LNLLSLGPIYRRFLRVLCANLPAVLVVLIFVFAGIFAIAPGGPRPALPISTVPGWASWFDIFVAFPLLSSLVVLVFRRATAPQLAAIAGLSLLPMTFAIVISYYWNYQTSSFSATTYYGVMAVEVGGSGSLAAIILWSTKVSWGNLALDRSARVVLWITASLSLGMAVLESALRPVSMGPDPFLWAGDIGITTAWGGYDLAHGINIYTTGLPPWGGPAGLPYGPGAFVLATPFSPLSIGLAAHLASLAFAMLCALALWRVVRLVASDLAVPTALLFLAAPMTSWAIQATVTSHLMVTFLILATLYYFLKNRPLLAGLGLSAATLTLLFPALLVVPIAISRRIKRPRFLLAFIVPTVAGELIPLAVDNQGHVANSTPGVASSVIYWLGYGALFGVAGAIVLAAGLFFFTCLLVWEVFHSELSERTRVLVACALMLAMTPTMIGYSYAAYYIWILAAALVALASLWNDASPALRETSVAQPVPSSDRESGTVESVTQDSLPG
jgi:hypothetical protein